MEMLYVFLPTVVAGIIQASCGFGSGIFMMLFFPLFMDMLPAAGLSCLISLFSNIQLTVSYRKHIRYKTTVLPLLVYFIVSFAAVEIATVVDMEGLKAYFGLFLVGLAVYFIIFSDRIHIRGGVVSGLVCSAVSGIGGGFFGIAGPPMVVYFLALAGDDKKCYIGTIQFFFFVTGLFVTVVRIMEGIITLKLLVLLIPGILGIFIGNLIGTKILSKINATVMRKMIYGFLALSGVVTFVTNL